MAPSYGSLWITEGVASTNFIKQGTSVREEWRAIEVRARAGLVEYNKAPEKHLVY